jgi:tRNA U34 5-carboxymethylaminomethyl modifying enzyme MnmG/GidA
MKMNLSVDFKKLVHDLRGPKGTAALTEEFDRISGELKKLRAEVKPQAQARLKRAEAQYQTLVKKLHAAQKDWDKTVAKRVSIVKKQAKEVEKNLTQYKKLAEKQKTKFQSAFTKKKATTKKAASKPAGTKKKTSKKETATA